MPAEPDDSLPKFLILDDDPDFLAYFLSFAAPYNIIFDICNTLKDALQKIQTTAHDAYIIDLNLPEGSGLDLIKEIRRRESDQKPIAVISGFFRDEQMFKLLRDQYSINFILDKPIYPQQVEELLVALCIKDPVKNLEPVSEIDAIKQKYFKTLSDKIVLLTELVKAVQIKPDTNSLTALKNAVHKIAGSAGSYGFSDVSTLCKELDFHIAQQLSSEKAIEKEWLESLDDFLRKIKFSFQFPNTKVQDLTLPIASPRPSLYIIDSDAKFLELLQREQEEFDIDLFVESNPEKALIRLQSPKFNPRVIVSSQTFFGSNISAFDLFEVVKKKLAGDSTIFSIIIEKESIDVRMEAIQKDVKYIFCKPLSAHLLLKEMTGILDIGYLRNFKVLVLDDDPDLCVFISSILSEIGIEVRAIESPLLLYKSLGEFSPNLLLLDLNLPKYDGFDLLKILKADGLYKNLIVVIITGRSEADTQINSYLGNAELILYKPLNKKTLQKCILNLAKKAASSELSTARNRIGLHTFKTLLKKLRDIIAVPTPISTHLVFFRIDQYSDLVLQQGQIAINEFKIFISNLLQRIEDNTTSCFSIDASTFAILFTGYNERIVENKTFDLLNSIQLQSNLETTLSSSIIPVSPHIGNNHEIIQLGIKTLKEAQNKEPAPIKIVTHGLQGIPSHKKILVLIESNEDLLLILKTAFDSQDLTVKTFREGKPALQELLSYHETDLPALIIAERKLPDMDGIEILKSLNARFKNRVPFYFLTDYVAEKDISEGVKYGALEYIKKPFSLALLIQKALKVIFEGKY